jgi:hypothetical protein
VVVVRMTSEVVLGLSVLFTFNTQSSSILILPFYQDQCNLGLKKVPLLVLLSFFFINTGTSASLVSIKAFLSVSMIVGNFIDVNNIHSIDLELVILLMLIIFILLILSWYSWLGYSIIISLSILVI